MTEDPSTFANLYIEKVLNELIELTKIRLMNETRIAYLEKLNNDLLSQIQAAEVKKIKPNKKHEAFEESSV